MITTRAMSLALGPTFRMKTVATIMGEMKPQDTTATRKIKASSTTKKY